MNSTRFMLDQAKEVVSLCKKLSNAPLVLGGAGYSMFPLQFTILRKIIKKHKVYAFNAGYDLLLVSK
jgi:hypothetical protein